MVRGHRDRIDARRLDQFCMGDRIVERDPAGLAHFARIELQPHRKIAADFAADRRDHLKRQAQAVFPAAAVPVGAGVGIGRGERRQQIAVPAVDFHAVKPGIARAAGAGGKLADRVVDVGLFQHLDFGRLHPRQRRQFFHQEIVGEIALGHGRHRRAPQRMAPARVAVARHEPAVVQLRHDLAPGGMDALDQARQSGQEAVIRNRGLARRHRAHRPGDARHPRNDQADAAPGLRLVIGDQPFAHGAIVFRHADPHRGHRDAVLQLERADAARREQVGITVRGHGRRHPVWRERAVAAIAGKSRILPILIPF